MGDIVETTKRGTKTLLLNVRQASDYCEHHAVAARILNVAAPNSRVVHLDFFEDVESNPTYSIVEFEDEEDTGKEKKVHYENQQTLYDIYGNDLDISSNDVLIYDRKIKCTIVLNHASVVALRELLNEYLADNPTEK